MIKCTYLKSVLLWQFPLSNSLGIANWFVHDDIFLTRNDLSCCIVIIIFALTIFEGDSFTCSRDHVPTSKSQVCLDFAEEHLGQSFGIETRCRCRTLSGLNCRGHVLLPIILFQSSHLILLLRPLISHCWLLQSYLAKVVKGLTLIAIICIEKFDSFFAHTSSHSHNLLTIVNLTFRHLTGNL